MTTAGGRHLTSVDERAEEIRASARGTLELFREHGGFSFGNSGAGSAGGEFGPTH